MKLSILPLAFFHSLSTSKLSQSRKDLFEKSGTKNKRELLEMKT
jgi:hypothetical protein